MYNNIQSVNNKIYNILIKMFTWFENMFLPYQTMLKKIFNFKYKVKFLQIKSQSSTKYELIILANFESKTIALSFSLKTNLHEHLLMN